MIKHIATLFVMVCVSVYTAAAQTTEKVVTKDGSEYEGYIAEQIPGQMIIVKTERATLFVNSSDVSNLTYHTLNIEDLPERFQLWAKRNHPEKETLEAASLYVNKKYYTDVVVLEKGVRLKLLSFANDSYKLNWKDVVRTVKSKDRAQMFANIYDVITLKNGKPLIGYVTEQTLGNELRIHTLSDEVHSVKFSDILSIRSEQVDKSKSLWTTLPVLDKLILKNGSSLEGFINSRIMGSHLTIITRDSAIEKTVKLGDIVKYLKLPNIEFNHDETDIYTDENKEDLISTDSLNHYTENQSSDSDSDSEEKEHNTSLETNHDNKPDYYYNNKSEISMNGLPMTLNSIMFNVNEDMYIVRSVIKDRVTVGTEIKIEMPIPYDVSDLKIIKMQLREMPAMATPASNSFPTIKGTDINNLGIRYSSKTISNGRMVLSTTIKEPGIYIIIPAVDNNKYIVFEVKG